MSKHDSATTDARLYPQRPAPAWAALALSCLLAGTAAAAGQGTTDGSFGGGFVISDFHGGTDEGYALAPLRDGRLLAAGAVTGPNAQGSGSSLNATVVRYLPDGRVDGSFGTAGRFEFDLGGQSDEIRALKVLPDGRILAVGSLTPKNDAYAQLALFRLNRNGQLDTTFGAADGQGGRRGYTLLDLNGPGRHDVGMAVALQASGKIVVGATTTVPVGNFSYQRVAVVRYSADGQLDTAFGEPDGAGGRKGWRVLPSFYTSDDAADYLSGFALSQSGALGPDGQPTDDRITVVGYTFGRASAFIGRLTADGDIDTSLSSLDPVSGAPRSGQVRLVDGLSNGRRTGLSRIAAARWSSAGRLLVAGSGGDRGMSVMRFLANGSLDASFAAAGSATSVPGRVTLKFSDISSYDEANALALQGNGKILVAGFATVGAYKDFFLGRLTADGLPDTAYGDGQGRAVVATGAQDDQAYALEVEPSGNVIAGGYADFATTKHDFALTRLIGDPDRLFFDDVEVHF